MNKKKQILRAYNVLVIALLALGAIYVCTRFVHLGKVVYTDNASVRRNLVPINTRVQGFIKEIRFNEFQYVHKGDTLVVLEDAEYQLAVAQAEAGVRSAESGSAAVSASIGTTESNVRTAGAGAGVAGKGENIASAATSVAQAGAAAALSATNEARVQMENAKKDYQRYEALLAKGAVTRQQFDNMRTAYESAYSRYESAVSRSRQAMAAEKVAKAQQQEASARLIQAQEATKSVAAVVREQRERLNQSHAGVTAAKQGSALARLHHSYTVILAPCDGYIGRKDIHKGQLVQPGQELVDIVSSDDVWVMANYRESQLKHIKVGAEVELSADAIPDVEYKGKVESISLATGSAYNHMPVDNATGNFVKVEQRVPVRIKLTNENASADLARLISGLNVECEVKY